MNHLIATLGYIKARLAEKSTYAGVVLAITGGAALTVPYSWLAIAAGVVGVLVPTTTQPEVTK